MTLKNNVWLVGDNDNLPAEEKLSYLGFDLIAEKREYTLLAEDLLDCPFVAFNDSIIEDPRWINFYSSMLHALASLDGFVSFVSLEVRSFKEERIIILPEKEWGQIRLASTGELVLNFSHNTRDNFPYFMLLDWVEEGWKTESLMEGIEKWSTVEIWIDFFLNLIQEEINGLGKKAIDLEVTARSLRDKAEILQEALSSL